MEAVSTSEALVCADQTTKCHDPDMTRNSKIGK